MRAHVNEPCGSEATFEQRGAVVVCDYCGGLSPHYLLIAMRAGMQVRFADWKYGWPHKLYVVSGNTQHAKFYTEHLMDAASEDVDELCQLILTATGVAFLVADDTLVWQKVPHAEVKN